MKASNLIAFALGAGACISLYACGGGSSSSGGSTMTPVPPSQPQMLMLTANDVLGRARAQSETADPFTVTGGSVTPVDDETSDPISVD